MAYNNGFPVNYQQMYPQFQPYPQNAMQPQMMTPPTIRAEIIQVGSEAEAANYPVAAGATQMLMLRDDSAICIKSAYANGQSSLTVYERRAEKQPQSGSEYVTRDELERRLMELTPVQQTAQKRTKSALNKEDEE